MAHQPTDRGRTGVAGDPHGGSPPLRIPERKEPPPLVVTAAGARKNLNSKGYAMYNDDEPMNEAAPSKPDERIDLMKSFVGDDNRLRVLSEQRERIEKDIAVTREHRSQVMARLGELLGFTEVTTTESDAAIDALRQRLVR